MVRDGLEICKLVDPVPLYDVLPFPILYLKLNLFVQKHTIDILKVDVGSLMFEQGYLPAYLPRVTKTFCGRERHADALLLPFDCYNYGDGDLP